MLSPPRAQENYIFLREGMQRYFCRVRGGAEGALGVEREPAMRMSTSRRALGSQPGRAVVWKTPMRARTKSLGSVSERRSPLAMARLTEFTKAV